MKPFLFKQDIEKRRPPVRHSQKPEAEQRLSWSRQFPDQGPKNDVAVPQEKTFVVVLDKILQRQRQMFPSAGHLEPSAMEKPDKDEFHTSDTPGRRFHHTQYLCETCRSGDGESPLDRTRCSLRATALRRSCPWLST